MEIRFVIEIMMNPILYKIIDTKMPIQFYGGETILSDDPILVQLAQQQQNERIRIVSVTGPVCYEIPQERVHGFLEFISTGNHSSAFHENLQGLAEDKFGRGLLTGWMDLKRFEEWLPKEVPAHLEQVFAQLRSCCESMSLLNMTEVYFDLYPMNQKHKHPRRAQDYR